MPAQLNRRSRHRTRSLLACVGALLAFAAFAAGRAHAEEARPAAAFVDSIGLATHTSYSDTPYVGEFATVKQRLLELGVRHIREDLAPERPDQYQRLNELAASGIRSTLVLGDPGYGGEDLQALLATLRDNLGGTAEAVEGPNEFDARGGAGWSAALSDYQRRLYAGVKSDPALAALPVLGPSIVQQPNNAALGDLSAALDYGNFHPYPNAALPEQNLTSNLSRVAVNAGGKPTIATETGYNTALASSNELLPVSERAMADYMPRLYLEYFRRGVARTFGYELLDEWADPGLEDPQSHFGLLHNDLSPKPAFTALRNLIAIIDDDGDDVAATPGLEYRVGGDLSSLHRMLLRKRDGSYYLALWRAVSVWDPASRTDLAVPATRATLDFDRQVSNVSRYLPNTSADPIGSVAVRNGQLSVEVGAQVVILRFDAGADLGKRATRIEFWASRHSVPAGGMVALGGRLHSQDAGRQTVSIQRWHAETSRWQIMGRARTTARGTFKKAIRISPAHFGRISRLRLVAQRTKPSKPLRITIRGGTADAGIDPARPAS